MEFRILNSIVLGLSLFLVASCTKEVHVDIPGFQEKIVIEGSIETDGYPFVLISKNKNVYAPTSQQEMLAGYLPGAQVWVSDGTDTIQLTEICSSNLPAGMDTVVSAFLGVPVDLLNLVNVCAYIGTDGNFKGQVGKTYTLRVDFEGKTYHSSSIILEVLQASSSNHHPSHS